MGMYVDSEVKSAVGRADVVIKMQDAIYVLEFKMDGTAEEALAQINSKGYAIPYEADHRKVVKVGINFDSTTRTIGDCEIAHSHRYHHATGVMECILRFIARASYRLICNEA